MGIHISYRVQESPRGIADGLIIADDFVGSDDVCLILGDNIFFGHGLPQLLQETKRDLEKNGGAILFGYWVHDLKGMVLSSLMKKIMLFLSKKSLNILSPTGQLLDCTFMIIKLF